MYDYIQTKGIGPKSNYPDDSSAMFAGTTSNCNSSTLRSPSYSRLKTFIRRGVQMPYGDCYSIV